MIPSPAGPVPAGDPPTTNRALRRLSFNRSRKTMRKISGTAALLLLLWACGSYQALPVARSVAEQDWKVRSIPATPQQEDGDAEAGREYFIAGDYIGSGVPYEFIRKKIAGEPDTVLARDGKNARVGYGATVFRAPNGVEVVNGNCMTCHAGELNGEVIVGVGNSFSDYRKSMRSTATMMNLGMKLKYSKAAPEYVAFRDFGQYFRAMAPLIQTNQPGGNPAFRLAEGCMRHRDPEDLTYVEEPLWEVWDYPVATDVPPLWHVKKKNALYYSAVGRGDFTKLLIQASVLGIPDSAAARHAASSFRDVLAWLEQLEPPPYPGPVDRDQAARGELLFADHCSKCHGTYGENETYPNKVVSLSLIKTDSLYAQYAAESGIVDWYNASWFATSEPKSWFEPERGYIAPPLDGIWASAPYLHNGSVPTVEQVLNSSDRPAVWTRSGDSRDYDWQRLGWNYTSGKKGKWTFDTRLPGYGNAGHYFGDKLNAAERKAVVEYLKTL